MVCALEVNRLGNFCMSVDLREDSSIVKIVSGVLEHQESENDPPPLTWLTALTRVLEWHQTADERLGDHPQDASKSLRP